MLEKRRINGQVIEGGRLRMRVHIYLLPSGGAARTRVFFDGRNIGRVGPGEHLTLLPSPGKNVIAVDDDWLALELAPNGQYYVRVSDPGSWPRTKAHLKPATPHQSAYKVTDLL